MSDEKHGLQGFVEKVAANNFLTSIGRLTLAASPLFAVYLYGQLNDLGDSMIRVQVIVDSKFDSLGKDIDRMQRDIDKLQDQVQP